jgi:hypothetical protein
VFTDQGRIVALRAQSTGSYACTAPGRQRRLEISGDGAVRFTDQNPDRTEPEDITVPSEIVLNASGIPVLRTELGPVEFRAPDTLAFAGETYERRR